VDCALDDFDVANAQVQSSHQHRDRDAGDEQTDQAHDNAEPAHEPAVAATATSAA